MSAKVSSHKVPTVRMGHLTEPTSSDRDFDSIFVPAQLFDSPAQKRTNSGHSNSNPAPNRKDLRRDQFSAELSIHDENYFDEPFEEILDNETQPNLKIFFEMSLYHILFFLVLGPFVSLLIFLKYKKITLARNLGFWGLSRNLFQQTLVFLINFIGLFGYLYFKVSIISPLEILMLFGGCVCRSFIIAIKYSLFPEKKINYVKQKLLTPKEVQSEFLLKWLNQIDQAVDRELMNTITRNNIDEDIFFLFFLRPLNPKLKAELDKWSFSARNHEKKERSAIILGDFQDYDKIVHGYAILRYLIKENTKRMNPSRIVISISISLSLAHAIIPVIYRYLEKSTLFGTENVEKIIGSCLFVGTVLFYFLNFLFMMIGIYEYQRQVNLLSQLSNLLSAKRVETYHTKKIFPTINFFCIISFRSWYSLNLMARDYGKKYFQRVEMYLAVFLLYYLILGLISILSIFNIISRFTLIYYIILVYELIIFFGLVFYIMIKGIIINDHFVIHQTLLNNLRQIVVDFLTIDHLYFQNEKYLPENEIYLFAKESIGPILKVFFGPNETRKPRELREIYFRNLFMINEFITKQLDFEKQYKPFKIFGIPATWATLQSLLAGIGTAFTLAFNQYIQIN